MNPIQMFIDASWVGKAVIVILTGLSIYSIAVMIDKFRSYKAARDESLQFLPLFVKNLKANDFAGALDSARKFKKSHIAKVVSAGLIEYDNDKAELADSHDLVGAVGRALDRAVSLTSAEMKKGTGGSRHDRLVGTLHRPVRYGRRHHQCVHRYRDFGIGRTRSGLGRYLRGADHDGVRHLGRRPGSHGVQLLHHAARAVPDRDVELLGRASRLLPKETRGRECKALRSRKSTPAINVTPLVDVMLVMLIIFMVVDADAPEGSAGDASEGVEPTHEARGQEPDPDRGLEGQGAVHREGRDAHRRDVHRATRRGIPAQQERDGRDQRATPGLTYGDVKKALLKVKESGFEQVGLISQRQE